MPGLWGDDVHRVSCDVVPWVMVKKSAVFFMNTACPRRDRRERLNLYAGHCLPYEALSSSVCTSHLIEHLYCCLFIFLPLNAPIWAQLYHFSCYLLVSTSARLVLPDASPPSYCVLNLIGMQRKQVNFPVKSYRAWPSAFFPRRALLALSDFIKERSCSTLLDCRRAVNSLCLCACVYTEKEKDCALFVIRLL